MDNSIIGDFSILSPSQKKELERKRQEQEAREAAMVAKRAEAARLAKEECENKIKALEIESRTKPIGRYFLITTLIIIIGVIVYYWVKISIDANGGDVWWGILIFIVLFGVVAAPIIFGLGVWIYHCIEEVRYIKDTYKSKIKHLHKKIE